MHGSCNILDEFLNGLGMEELLMSRENKMLATAGEYDAENPLDDVCSPDDELKEDVLSIIGAQ